MDDIDKLIESISFPVAIPAKAFFTGSKKRILADFSAMIEQLPEPIVNFVDMDSTTSRFGDDSYQFKLRDGGYLRVRVINDEIVELTRIHKPS
jgi:hypothetical protein